VHHIRFFLIGDEVALPVFGKAGVYLGQDFSVLALGVELHQLRHQAGTFGCGLVEMMRWNIPATKSLIPSLLDSMVDMETREVIQKEIEAFPEPYLEEILDFIHFLKGKASKKRMEMMETAILSESVLAKDWLSLEEDEAWKNL